MNIINEIDERTFSLNGVEYLKNYISTIKGDRLVIFNCYENKDILVELTHFNQFMVNDDVYSSAILLQSALLDVIYSRANMGEGSAFNQNNVGKILNYTLQEGIAATASNVSTALNNNSVSFLSPNILPFTVTRIQTPVFINIKETIGGVSTIYIYLFTGGEGRWGFISKPSLPGIAIAPQQLFLVGTKRLTPEDIANDPNSDVNNLDPVVDGDFVSKANESVWDFSDSGSVQPDGGIQSYYFTFTEDGVLYFALFKGVPGVYGLGGTLFTENDFVITTNSTVTPEKTKTSEFINDGDGESKFLTTNNIFSGKNVNFPASVTLRPFRVLERNNRYFTDISCEDLIRGKLSKMLPYYVNYETGSDSNNGLKETLPFKTIAAAYTAGARLIYLTGGIHKNDSWGSINDSYTNTDDLFIIGTGDKPTYITSAPASNPVYTLESGSTYQCTLSVAKSVVDMKYLDKKGFPLRLDFKNSLTEVNASPGSYWVDNTTVYVHLKDGRTPDSSVINLTRNNSGKYRGNQGYHFVKNVIFMGGSLTCGTHGVESQTGVGSTLISFQKSCMFLYGESGLYNNNGGEGTRNVNNYLTWSEDCVSYGNARDGFNYLAETGVGNKVVEIRCQGFDNGLRLTSSSVNGSSNHGGGVSSQVIRVDCKYYRNSGPNVIDIDGCQTANFGVTSFESVAPIGPDNNNVDFGIGGLAGGVQYNYGCVSMNGISFRIGGVNECHIINDPNTVYTGSLIIETPSAPQSITFAEFPIADVAKTELPLLSAYTAAPIPVTKLYTSLGTNTDGGLDQNTATANLSLKQNLVGGNIITGVQTYSDLTTSALAAFNGSKNLVSLSTSTYPSFTELTYLKGVTSAIQSQINNKAPLASPVFTGNPTAPTPTPGDNDTSIATTEFVVAEVKSSKQAFLSTNYTVISSDFGTNGEVFFQVGANAGNLTITLPANMIGKAVNIMKVDNTANTVTVKGDGTKNINAANTKVLTAQYENVRIVQNGDNYYIV